jgi:hypothetical protein
MIGAACDMGMDDSSASAAPPAQLATPTPSASKVPVVAKTSTPNALKQAAVKTKAPVPDQKVAVGTTN